MSNLLKRYIRLILETKEVSENVPSEEEDVVTLLSAAQENPKEFLKVFLTKEHEFITRMFKLPYSAMIIACIRKGLNVLGQGSSRIVFDYDNKSVIKLSTNAAGDEQNALEATIAADAMVGPIVANVLEKDENFHWIIAEKVRPIKSEAEFSMLSGIDFGLFKEKIRTLKEAQETKPTRVLSAKDTDSTVLQKSKSIDYQKSTEFEPDIKQGKGCISGYDFIDAVEAFMKRYKKEVESKHTDLFVGDITKFDSWGVTDKGCLVLFDYGVTKKIYKSYYEKGIYSPEKEQRTKEEKAAAAARYESERLRRSKQRTKAQK